MNLVLFFYYCVLERTEEQGKRGGGVAWRRRCRTSAARAARTASTLSQESWFTWGRGGAGGVIVRAT